MLLFVSIWNRKDTKGNKIIKERQNKTQNEERDSLVGVCQRVSRQPRGFPLQRDSARVRKWHASLD